MHTSTRSRSRSRLSSLDLVEEKTKSLDSRYINIDLDLESTSRGL